jgi:hypothetical protein
MRQLLVEIVSGGLVLGCIGLKPQFSFSLLPPPRSPPETANEAGGFRKTTRLIRQNCGWRSNPRGRPNLRAALDGNGAPTKVAPAPLA